MKNFIVCIVFLLACAVSAQAQHYKTAIGLRLGYPTSVSLKHFFNEKGAAEVYAGFRRWDGYGWTTVGATYQHHGDIESVDGLSWYVGGGAAAYFWNFDFLEGYNSTTFSVLGVGGVDFKFPNAPVNLSVDWMPTFFFNGYYSGFASGYGALSARFAFGGGDD